MKIIIPVFQFGKGGGDRVLVMLANEWIKCGHSVSFIAFGYSDIPNFSCKANIIWVDFRATNKNEALTCFW